MFSLNKNILKNINNNFKYLKRNYNTPLNEIEFLIYEVFKFPERYLELGYDKNIINKESISAVINETSKFAINELAILNKIADNEGCKYIGPHEVKSPSGFKEAYQKYQEGQWVGLSFPTKYGGQDFPHSVSVFHTEILGTACQSWSSYTVSYLNTF